MASIEQRGKSFRIIFRFEGQRYAQLIPKWRFAGYRVILFFLWLPSAELAIARVATRVQQGGHNIPESTIRRRFNRGLANLRRLYLPVVDETHIYEASVLPPIFVWKAESGKETVADGKKWTIIESSLEHPL